MRVRCHQRKEGRKVRDGQYWNGRVRNSSEIMWQEAHEWLSVKQKIIKVIMQGNGRTGSTYNGCFVFFERLLQ